MADFQFIMSRILTLTGASGAGKSSIARELLRLPHVRLVRSVTTRSPRVTDLAGEYEYLSLDEFKEREQKNAFYWSTPLVHGNRYGTQKTDLDAVLQDPRIGGYGLMILVPVVIPLIRLYAPGKIDSVYIQSPPVEDLRWRLTVRGESQDTLDLRIAECRQWDVEAEQSGIPYLFIKNNGLLSDTVLQLVEKYVDW